MITSIKFPLSEGQKGISIYQKLKPKSLAYHIFKAIQIDNVDSVLYEKAVVEIIKKHALLTSRICSEQGEDFFVTDFYNTTDLLEKENLSSKFSSEELRNLVSKKMQIPLKLDEKLAKIFIFQLTDKKLIFAVAIHHIICDFWSLGLFLKEIIDTYESYVLDKKRAQNSPTTSYSDYVERQQQYLKSEKKIQDEKFWKDVLHESKTLELRTINHNSFDEKNIPCRENFSLDGIYLEKFNSLKKELKIHSLAILLTAFQGLIYRTKNLDKFVIGTSITGKSRLSFRDCFGYFINPIPIPLKIDGAEISEQLKYTSQVVRNCLDHSEYPYKCMLENIARETANSQIIRVMFTYQKAAAFSGDLIKHLSVDLEDVIVDYGSLKIHPIALTPIDNEFDLTILASELDDSLLFSFEYNANFYRQDEVKNLAMHFKSYLQLMLNAPSQTWDQIETLSSKEKQFVEGENYLLPSDCFPKIFESKTKEFSEKVAAECHQKQITYSELNKRSNFFANLLSKKGISKGQHVAVCVDYSFEFLAIALGILKCGAVFIPLDPQNPREYNQGIVENSHCAIIFTETPWGLRSKIIEISLDSLVVLPCDTINSQVLLSHEDIAYIIHTSGTTGRPKGVMISHGAFLNYILDAVERYKIEEDTLVVSLFTSPAFDLTITSIFAPLLSGGLIAIYPGGFHRNLPSDVIKKANLIKMTPSHLKACLFSDCKNSRVKKIVLGGEKLFPKLIKEAFEAFPCLQAIYNEYGPTETTVGCIVEEITKAKTLDNEVAIGKCMRNVNAMVLDDNLSPVPFYSLGYLYIGGKGVANGYYNQPKKSAEVFLPHLTHQGKRMYFTGDLVVRLPDDTFLYEGRVDHQIKVRGYRIELSGLDQLIMDLVKVKDAKVIYEKENEKLFAFLVCEEESQKRFLLDQLKARMPPHFIPDDIIFVSHIPMNNNGKVDIEALRKQKRNDSIISKKLAQNMMQEQIASIWCYVLNLKNNEIDIDKHFIQLGGDSIKALQVCSKFNEMQLSLTLQEFFQHPTISSQAKYLEEKSEKLTTEKYPLIPNQSQIFSPAQKWFLTAFGGEVEHYNHSIVIRAHERIVIDKLNTSLNEVISIHPVLQMKFLKSQENEWSCYFDTNMPFELVEKWVTTKNERSEILEESQKGFHFSEGPMLRCVVIHDSESDFVCLACHHLLIDGVSWQIFLEELANRYETETKSSELISRDNYFHWLEHLPEKIKLLQMDTHLDRELVSQNVLHYSFENFHKLSNKFVSILSDEIDVQDLLIFALARAWSRVFNQEQAYDFILEHHGRDFGNLDLSKSIGWFTLFSNLSILDEELICPFKALHNIRKCRVNNDKNAAFSSKQNPKAQLINFLGDILLQLPGNAFQVERFLFAECRSANLLFPHSLEWNFYILDKKLHASIGYNKDKFTQEKIELVLDEVDAIFDWFGNVLLQESEQKVRQCIKYGVTLAELNLINEKVECTQQQSVSGIYPLTPSQLGIFLQSKISQYKAYWIEISLTVNSEFSADLMTESFNLLVNEYESLRTIIIDEGLDEPKQVILDKLPPSITLNSENKTYSLNCSLTSLSIAQCDDGHKLLFRFHHILVDGWCLGLIFEKLLATYERLLKEKSPLGINKGQYRNFLEWSSTQNLNNSTLYWKNYLLDFQCAGQLNPIVESTQFSTQFEEVKIRGENFQAFNSFVRENFVTPASVIYAVWGVFLHKMLDSTDVVFGRLSSGRAVPVPYIDEMVGLFSSIVPIRVQLNSSLTFSDLVQHVQNELLNSEGHTFPIHQLHSLHELGSRLIDHILVVENYPLSGRLSELAEKYDINFKIKDVSSTEYSHYPLNVLVFPFDNSLEIKMVYNSQAHSKETIRLWLDIFEDLIINLITASKVPLVTVKNQSECLSYSPIQTSSFTNPIVTQTFDEKALQFPEFPAVVFKEHSINYEQLKLRSDRFASALIAKGIKQGDVVAVSMHNSIDLVVAILGVFKSGAIYFPMDPDLPLERMYQLFDQAKPKLCIVDLEKEIWGCEINTFESFEKNNFGEFNNHPSPQAIAYLLFTSGSTGTPKGVLVSHESFANTINWRTHEYQLNQHDRSIQLFAFSFDPFLMSLFTSLTTGGQFRLLGKEEITDVKIASQYVQKDKITYLNCLPSYLKLLVKCDEAHTFGELKQIMLGGEKPEQQTLKETVNLLPYIKIHNEYGPTECSVMATVKKDITSDDTNNIGIPIRSMGALVLNQFWQEVPKGGVGELCLFGKGVANGYFEAPAITSEKFIPFFSGNGLTMYRTGDVVRMRPNGEIEFIGRIDEQIKFRGFRIELDEIKNHIKSIEGVLEAEVLFIREKKCLVAYVSTSDDEMKTTLKLRLSQGLPYYMMPSNFIYLEKLPRTSTGKIDRQELLKIPLYNETISYSLNDIETNIANIWSEVLRIPVSAIAPQANFFEMGGHSLAAMQVQQKMNEQFKLSIPIHEIFSFPTVHRLAQLVNGSSATSTKTRQDKIVSREEKRSQWLKKGNRGSSYGRE